MFSYSATLFAAALLCNVKLFSKGNFGISVLLNAFDAVYAACLSGVALGSEDGLAVLSLEAETELAGLVLVDLKLGMLFGCVSFNGLVLYSGDGSILLNALDAVEAGSLGSIYFGSADNLMVASEKIKLDAGVYGFY